MVHFHSIVTAHRDTSPLAFLVTSVAILTEQSSQQPNRSNEDKLIICGNCESEVATFKCLQPGCPCNQANCGLCDRVFHKAVAKRSHIRIPLPASSASIKRSLGVLLHMQSTGSGATDIIQPVRDKFIQDVNIEQQQPPHQRKLPLFSCPIIALLLASIRAIIDDRRIRMLEIPGAMLSPIISSYIKFYSEFIEYGGK